MKIEHGQVAVITGGASGIGLGLAERLGARGVNLVLADIREEALGSASTKLGGFGVEVLTVRTDVSEESSVRALAQATMSHFGRVDLVCNNAGVVCEHLPMWEQQVSTWQWLIGVKLMGVIYGVRAFAPLLLARGVGHILNTASSGGLMPLPTMTPYNATMHAVVGITETLNLELRKVAPGVGATVLCPGLVVTNLSASSAALRPDGAKTVVHKGGMEMSSFISSLGNVVTPEVVANAASAGIESDQVHVVTNMGIVPMIRARVESILADLPDEPRKGMPLV